MCTKVIKLNHRNFYQICRICCEQNELKNIFLSRYKDVTFATILENIVNLQIKETDGLPPNACLKCLKTLLNFMCFLDQFKISSESLKSFHSYLYKNNNVENSSRRRCRQINFTKIPDINNLLNECTFINSSNNQKVSSKHNLALTDILNAPVEDEQIQSLSIKHEFVNEDQFEQELKSLSPIQLSALPCDHKRRLKKRTSSDLKLQCIECGSVFKTLAGVSAHKKSDHAKIAKPNQEFLCAICNNSYNMKYQLCRHISVSHKQCTCDRCGTKLKRSSLTKHLKMHEPDYKPYKPPRNRRLCTVCGQSVRYNFNAHMRSHQEQGKCVKYIKGLFQCNYCPFETPHWTSLYRHKLRHKEKPFLCNTCGKDFSGKEFFDKHMKLHEPFDKPTSCYVCSETFTNEFDYGKHLSSHTYYIRKLSNFDEYLKRKGNYKKRVSRKGSNEEKPQKPKRIPNPSLRKVKTTYKCEPCNKIFKDNAHLQIHVIAIHENKREHKCPYCGKGFNLPNSLQEHIRTHTGETLKCDYCEKTFKQNSTRYKHLREAHNVHLGQIRKAKSKERKEKDDIRRAYKKLRMKLEDTNACKQSMA